MTACSGCFLFIFILVWDPDEPVGQFGQGDNGKHKDNVNVVVVDYESCHKKCHAGYKQGNADYCRPVSFFSAITVSF